MEKILIISGEISGDMYAGKLAETLRQTDPEVMLYGVGGESLKSQILSENFVIETGQNHVMGEWENWKKRHDLYTLLDGLSTFLSTHSITQAVLIDYPYANFAISRVLQKYHVPIMTFITPNFWIWQDVKKAKMIAAYSQKIVCIFEREAQFYRSFHSHVYYFGHPLFSLRKSVLRDEEKKCITLFPGSRKQEIHYHFPAMLGAIQLYQKQGGNLPIQIAVINEPIEKLIHIYLQKLPIQSVYFEPAMSSTLLSKSKLLLCVAGTVTLEALIARTPMIVLGAVSPITYFLGKYILRVKMPWIALPNIVSRKSVVPEFIQYFNPVKIVQTMTGMLSKDHAELTRDYLEIIQKMSIVENPFNEIANLLLYSTKIN